MALDHWYDGQLRRYWLQFCRIFDNVTYKEGVGADGTMAYRTFPIKLASKDRQIGHILRNNSENTVLSCPRLSARMTDLAMDADRRQHPSHVSTVNVVERAIDPVTNKYTGAIGNTYSVERYMGVPFQMEMTLDIWTSNESQKHQFMEQILMLFNPAIDLQTSTNPLDWGALTIVELTGINWSDRSFPIMDEDVEVSSLTFKMPIWIQPPAKVKRQNIIQQIITNIATVPTGTDMQAGDGINFSEADYHTRIIVTPNNHLIQVAVEGSDYMITLLDQFGLVDENLKWIDLLNQYGLYRPGISQLRLKTTADMDDHDSDIIGTYTIHPTEPNKLIWQPDMETMPSNTLANINRMITLSRGEDFVGVRPGIELPDAAEGQRYLLAEDLVLSPDGGNNGWSNLVADRDDIIEYQNGTWVKVFDASVMTQVQYVTNSFSGKQLKWNGEMWIMAVDGDYRPGAWRIFL